MFDFLTTIIIVQYLPSNYQNLMFQTNVALMMFAVGKSIENGRKFTLKM